MARQHLAPEARSLPPRRPGQPDEGQGQPSGAVHQLAACLLLGGAQGSGAPQQGQGRRLGKPVERQAGSAGLGEVSLGDQAAAPGGQQLAQPLLQGLTSLLAGEIFQHQEHRSRRSRLAAADQFVEGFPLAQRCRSTLDLLPRQKLQSQVGEAAAGIEVHGQGGPGSRGAGEGGDGPGLMAPAAARGADDRRPPSGVRQSPGEIQQLLGRLSGKLEGLGGGAIRFRGPGQGQARRVWQMGGNALSWARRGSFRGCASANAAPLAFQDPGAQPPRRHHQGQAHQRQGGADRMGRPRGASRGLPSQQEQPREGGPRHSADPSPPHAPSPDSLRPS